jgi:Predicted membrane protein
MNKTRSVVFMGLLIAMEVILTRYLSIETPIVRIGFGFLPAVISCIMFGPLPGGIMGALSDIIGMIVFPKGAYFPGFTLSAFLSGVIYGFILYKKPVSFIRISIAVLIVTVFVDLGLNTLWLTMIMNKAAAAIIAPRLLNSVAMLPVKVISVKTVWQVLSRVPDLIVPAR